MKEKILVVDDDRAIRATFEGLLLEEGYGVATAEDYHEALTRLDETDFDLIFADIFLGDKTGIDLLREVRKRGMSNPVVMITGDPNIDTASEALRLGAFDYIPKPVRQRTLLHVTGMALQHKALSDEREQYRSNLEAIFRSVKDAIITVDKELRVLEVNEAAQNLCGFSRDVIGKPFGSLPPLRERREDLPLLVDHFLKRLNERSNKGVSAISQDVLKIFMDYPWPGNIRELEHTLEHAFILCHQSVITLDDLPPHFSSFTETKASSPKVRRDDHPQAILQALEKTGWNKSKAARLLGISRRTIYRKIEEHKIAKDREYPGH